MSVKNLMTDLADSVRLKTGKTGKMTLQQLAAAITGITVSGDIGYTSGTFKATTSGAARSVKHGLEQVPGAVVLIKLYATDSPTNTTAGTTTSLNDILFSAVYGKKSGYAYCYSNAKKTISSSGTTTTSSTRNWKHTDSVPTSIFGSGNSAAAYNLTNINETSFTTPKYLVSGRTYLWIAFRAELK